MRLWETPVPIPNKMCIRDSSGSGDEEIRTLDPLLARQVLSQLSYIPIIWRPPALPHQMCIRDRHSS